MPTAILTLAFACLGGSPDPSQSSVALGAASSAMKMTVQLSELSGPATPVGLPSRFLIQGSALPRAGERVDVVWKALDGQSAPREGSGLIEVDARADRLMMKLGAAGHSATALLTLSGAISGRSIGGKFSDRLYAPRAGRFEGRIDFEK